MLWALEECARIQHWQESMVQTPESRVLGNKPFLAEGSRFIHESKGFQEKAVAKKYDLAWTSHLPARQSLVMAS